MTSAIRLATARQLLKDWVSLCIIRHYAIDLRAGKVERDGSVVVTITCRVPATEITDRLWHRPDSP